MSNLDSNPFADPDENPFGESGTHPSGQVGALDDYNPFAQKAATPAATLPPPPPAQAVAAPQPNVNQSAVIQPTAADPPPYTAAAAQQVDTSELQRRQEELERKAAELQEKEQKLRNRSAAGAKENNWPPLPASCPLQPCFYQDFELDIPPEFQRVCKLAYYTWITRSIVLILNFFFNIAYFALSHNGTNTAGTSFGLSILWMGLWIPLSFLCWYRPVYKALRSDSSINYFWFFLNAFIQVLVDIVMVIGPAGSGYLGLLTSVAFLNDTTKESSQAERNMGGVMLIIMIGSIILLCLDLFLLIKVHNYYRGTGASFQKAQSEFTTGVLQNESVRQAGSQMAAEAASGAMAGAAASAHADNKY